MASRDLKDIDKKYSVYGIFSSSNICFIQHIRCKGLDKPNKKKVKRKQLCVLNKIKMVFKNSSSVCVFKKCQKKNKKEMKQALKADWIPEKQYKQFLINAYYF